MATKNFIIFYCWVVWVTGHEFHSSTDRMASLMVKEQELLESFSYFIAEEEEYLEELRSALLELEFLYPTQSTDVEMSDPLAAYKLMRRLRDEGAMISKYIKRSPAWDYLDYLKEELEQLPGQDDIDGAAHGIIQLQDIYKLYPEDITTDPLTGRTAPLNLDESFHLGTTAYLLENFQHAFLWFLQCVSQMTEGATGDVTMFQVLDYLGSSAYRYGNLHLAIYFTEQLVNLDPTEPRPRDLLDFYESKYISHTSNSDILTLNKTSRNTYEALCRGEAVKMKSRRKRLLTCRYSTAGGNPRLMYTPLKEEEEWNEPPIMRYHNVVSDTEIEFLKNISRPLLKRSQVQDKDGLGKVSYGRVSQSTWIPEEYDPVVSRITQRLSDITGMDMESADTMEVLNYGIGGDFKPHYDALELKEFNSRGDRIATIIIYLSDGSIGGSTVFPKIGALLKPQKGSAVMWYNLRRNGELDERSLHAGCPVFRGSKWVAVKWVYERGQEFRRPCALSETE